MKRALVFGACAYQYPHSGVILEEIEELLADGWDVTFAHCSGIRELCFCNPEGNPGVCAVCKWCQRQLLKPFRGRCAIVPLRAPRTARQKRSFSYSDNRSIKAIEYRDVKIGYAALSNYVSLTRNAAPKVDAAFRSYFDAELSGLCDYVDAVVDLFDKVKPEAVSYVTGRNSEQRPFYDLAKARGIRVRSVEFESSAEEPGVIYKMLFDNALPHDIPYAHRTINELWDRGSGSEEEKRRIGRSFYEKRASGRKLNTLDLTFTSRFVSGTQIEGLDPTKRHLVIFNSSEDEFVAVGPEYDSYAVFESQAAGVRQIAEALHGSGWQVILRVHPNLQMAPYPFHTDLYKLPAEFPGLLVIPADSPVSSYELLEVADRVAVFNSTMGAEAAYRGKAVILLAGVFYAHLGIAYRPKSPGEALALLKRDDLPPMDNMDGVLRYGHSVVMRHKLAHPLRHYDLRQVCLTPVRLFGTRRYGAYLKAWGSRRIMAYVLGRCIPWARRHVRDRCKLPDPVKPRWF